MRPVIDPDHQDLVAAWPYLINDPIVPAAGAGRAGKLALQRLANTRRVVITQWDGDPANCAPDEHDDLRWVTPEEISTLTLADPLALPGILGAIETPLR